MSNSKNYHLSSSLSPNKPSTKSGANSYSHNHFSSMYVIPPNNALKQRRIEDLVAEQKLDYSQKTTNMPSTNKKSTNKKSTNNGASITWNR